VEAQLRAIVGVELRISRIEGTAKWSQNRSDADREGVIAELEHEGQNAEAALVARKPSD
jgi:transcriptional regulator